MYITIDITNTNLVIILLIVSSWNKQYYNIREGSGASLIRGLGGGGQGNGASEGRVTENSCTFVKVRAYIFAKGGGLLVLLAI